MSQIHAKTDKLSLVAVPAPDGKMRVTSQSWDDPLVLLSHPAAANSYSSATKDHSTSFQPDSREMQVEFHPFGARVTVTGHALRSKMRRQ